MAPKASRSVESSLSRTRVFVRPVIKINLFRLREQIRLTSTNFRLHFKNILIIILQSLKSVQNLEI